MSRLISYLFILLAFLAVCIVGLLVAPNFVDWNHYKSQIQEQVQKASGYDMRIDGDISVALLPTPHASLAQVQVINPDVSSDPFVSFEVLSVELAIAPLFNSQVELTSIELNKPVFDLRKSQSGKVNWLSSKVQNVLDAAKTSEGAVREEVAQAATSSRDGSASNTMTIDEVVLKAIKVRGGVFKFSDAGQGKDVKIDDIDVDMAVTLKDKPSLRGDVSFDTMRIGINSVSNTSGDGRAAPVSTKVSGGAERLSNDAIDTAFLNLVDANLKVSGQHLIYDRWNITSPSLEVVMRDSVLNLEKLSGDVFGGSIALIGEVSATDNVLSLSSKAKIANVNIARLSEALANNKLIRGEGGVSLDVNALASGSTQRELVNSLRGDAQLKGQDIILKGFDLAGLAKAMLESNKPLARVQEVITAASANGETAFDTVNGSYSIHNGVVMISSMQLDGAEASIQSEGTVNVSTRFIDTVHLITLKKAQGVEPFPVTIKGPLDNPGNTFGAGLFEAYFQNKLKGKILEKTNDLLDDKTRSKLQRFGILPSDESANDNEDSSSGDNQQPEDQTEKVIRGVLKGLLQ